MAPTLTEQAVAKLVNLRSQYPKGDATPEEIGAFLAEVAAAVALFNGDENRPADATTKGISIYPEEVEYEHSTGARSHLKRVQTAQRGWPVEFTDEELEVEVQARGKLNIAHNRHFRQSRVNFLVIFATAPFINFAKANRDGWFEEELALTMEERRAMWSRHEVPGHIIVARVEDQVVSSSCPPLTIVYLLTPCLQMTVYDPAFSPHGPPVYNKDGSPRRLGEVTGWALARKWRDMIGEYGKRVQKVQGGGGGNTDGLCRRMSYRWLVEEMIGLMDPDEAWLGRCKT